MEASKTPDLIIDWFLKTGIVLFIGSIFFELIINQKPDNEVWFWVLRILLVILYIGLTATIFAIDKLEFYVFGFFLVLMASLYKIITIVAVTFRYPDIPVYLLLIFVSVYFFTKAKKVRKHHS